MASPPDWRIAPTAPEHAEALARLQRLVFPTLDPAERFEAAHYRRHLEIFPEGQFAALAAGPPETPVGATKTLAAGPPETPVAVTAALAAGPAETPVAATSTLRLDFDFDHPHHTFPEVAGGLFLCAHDPKGAWLYGADVSVHPGWRRRGIARALYAARRETVRRLGLRGQLTVGMLNGYGALAGKMTAEDYYQSLVAGEFADPTVSAQLRVGFRPRGLIPGYVNDPRCGGYGVLLVLPAAGRRTAGRESPNSP